MLVFLLLGLCFSPFSPMFLPLFLISFSLFFLSSSSYSSQQGVSFYYFSDSMSLLLVTLTIFVLFISSLSAPRTPLVSFVLLSLLTACFIVFASANALAIFIFYEISLFPILYIVLKWGSYPERSLSAIMLLGYTIVFTLPFIYVLAVLYSQSFSWSLPALNPLPPLSSDFLCSLVFLAFAVKLPVYGLHFWLPIAHVEAPTFGSMILAGVLLKLGGVGLFRFLPLFDITFLRTTLCSYAAVFLVFSTLVCCVQSDFNRLIAFSSVSHMMSLVPIVALNSDASVLAGTYLMVLHGISSPLLFFLVGFVYESQSTRQLILLRGSAVTSPLLTWVLSFSFFYNLSAPPFPSFVSEALFFAIAFAWSSSFSPFLAFFAMFSLVYNLAWFSSLSFNSSLSLPQTYPLTPNAFTIVALSGLFTSCVLFLIFFGVLG